MPGSDLPLYNPFYSHFSTPLLKGAAHYSGSLCEPLPGARCTRCTLVRAPKSSCEQRRSPQRESPGGMQAPCHWGGLSGRQQPPRSSSRRSSSIGHSLFQCLPQVLEPALRRHQLLQLIDQSLRLQETQSVAWRRPQKEPPSPRPGGVKPVEPQGGSHPAHPPLWLLDTFAGTNSALAVTWLLVASRGAEQARESKAPPTHNEDRLCACFLPPSPPPTFARACFNLQICHFAGKKTMFHVPRSPRSCLARQPLASIRLCTGQVQAISVPRSSAQEFVLLSHNWSEKPRKPG